MVDVLLLLRVAMPLLEQRAQPLGHHAGTLNHETCPRRERSDVFRSRVDYESCPPGVGLVIPSRRPACPPQLILAMSKLNVTEWEAIMLKVSQLEQSVMALRGDVEKISAHLQKNYRISRTPITINDQASTTATSTIIGFIQGELQKMSSPMLMMAT